MKWLLITSGPPPDALPRSTLNPGDDWARMGVELLIQEVDPYPVFDLLNKADPVDCLRERPFDRAVLCGMPLWWSHPEHECQDIYWWHYLIRGWPTADKRKFLVAGAGSVTGVSIHSPQKFASAVGEVIDRSFAVITRNVVLDDRRLIPSICPASFAIWSDAPKTRRLVNLMPSGAHDPIFDPAAAEMWEKQLSAVSGWAFCNGFEFVAHSKTELALAESLGWPATRVHFWENPASYLDLYAGCAHYVGNRMHGATVVSAAGGLAVAIGYDSRMEMARRVGSLTMHPASLDFGALDVLLGHTQATHPDVCVQVAKTLRVERETYRSVLTQFAWS